MSSLTQLSYSIENAPKWHESVLQGVEQLTVAPIADAPLGAVVTGLDARQPQNAQTILTLKKALQDHLILVFKQQNLTDEQLLAFASYFGAIFKPPVDIPVLATQKTDGLPPDVVPVSNAVGKGDYTGNNELTPHSDHHWTPQPSSGSLLYALEIPSDGGATSWYNTVQAYQDLDEETKQEIRQLQLITYNPFLRHGTGVYPKYRFSNQEILGAAFPHPLVRTHSESGKLGLYLDTHTEVEVVGYDDQKGAQLIERLRQHIAQPKYRYEHQWEIGDIVFWDNQLTLHSRTAFPAEQRRLLKRVSLAGGRPF
ncbi:TauD/TfdA family dioxygenase [Acinetobacter puyangensis]|uniref:Taurine dioxygenase n=1 Tax=Acinetobacter puyangensis TaxID=1096779 RepID=A0A240EBB1_9GAMM|nr:TauD/TfdA family dioxygenase [Acinetobacter puyangensis]SNX45952.1 taurine dioxygenase [Acinetobacter puyangensis]